MDFGIWLNNNPSGFDHHDPENFDGFFDELEEINESFERDFHLK